jgi:hypothetical protein
MTSPYNINLLLANPTHDNYLLRIIADWERPTERKLNKRGSAYNM